MSGPIGAQLVPNTQAAQVWIKFINQRGGLNGHEVKGIVYDDGADPARHVAQVKEAVERRHVVAFLAMNGALTGNASADYIASKRVPVVGGDGTPFLYRTPMHFPNSSGFPFYGYTLLPALKQMAPDTRKIAVLTCTEAQVCNDVDRIWSTQAAPEGFELVYRGKVSVAQPDYTAECLSARNAGAQYLLIALDSSSAQRLATACFRQGYQPKMATMSAPAQDYLKEDPQLDGLVASVPTFPHFQTGTPGTDEFRAAMKAFAPGATISSPTSLGWVSGKLLEKAGAAMPEPPTSQAILDGLWALKDETLGGLTSPLNFVRDQTAPPTVCWFSIMIRKGSWISPDKSQMHCRPVTGS